MTLVTTNGLLFNAVREGAVNRRYKDSVGVWTFGIGHTAAAGAPDPKTLVSEQSFQTIVDVYKKDAKVYSGYVDKYAPAFLTTTQKDALFSFCFNLGPGNLQKLVKGRNASQIGDAITLYTKTPASLHQRRLDEQKLYKTGNYGLLTACPVYPASDAGVVQWAKVKKVDLTKYFDAPQNADPVPAPVPSKTSSSLLSVIVAIVKALLGVK